MAKVDKFSLADMARKAMGENVSKLDTVSEVVKISRDRIDANEANFYEMSDLETLADSIALTGLLHPLLVKPGAEEGRYTLIDGERRFRAMGVLEWVECPAIIQRPASTVLEKLMLIEANRTQRKMNSAELSKQAEEYTELLAELKRSGVEIPGRLRDAVAQALDVSASKLARLHAIRKNVIPDLLVKFDEGKLNESAAYELSKLPEEKQTLFARKAAGNLTAYDVKDLALYHEQCFEERACPYGGNCDHCETMYKVGAGKASYSRCVARGYASRNGCCKTCPDREKCKSLCTKAKPDVQKEVARNIKKAEAKAAKEAESRQKRVDAAAADWVRLDTLRAVAGIEANDRRLNEIDWRWPQLVDRSRTPEYWETQTVVETLRFSAAVIAAELFGVSLDELAGRSAPGGWDWKDGRKELPQSEDSREMVITWGPTIGVRCVPVKDYQDYRDNFKGNYDWWCRPQLPTPEREGEE